MQVQTLFSLVLVLGIMVGIGSLLARYVSFQGEVKKALVMIIVNVAMPSMIFYSIFQLQINQELLRQMGMVLILSVVFHTLGIALGWFGSFATRADAGQRREMAVLSALGNTGFIGIPLCAAFFGPIGAVLAAIYDSVMDVVIFTVVAVMLGRGAKFSLAGFKTLLNIPLLTTVLSCTVAFLGLRPPEMVMNLTGKLAGMTVPLAMIYIGMLLTLIRIRTVLSYLPLLWTPVLCKLLIFPALFLLVMMGLHMDTDVSRIVLVETAMPIFTMASVIFAYFRADEQLAAVATAASTLLCMLTIPVVIMLGHWVLG